MKNLHLAAITLMLAFSRTFTASAQVPGNTAAGTEATASLSAAAPIMSSRLEYRFFQNKARKNYFTLTLERTLTEPATLVIVNQDGAQVYRAGIEGTSLVRHFDMNLLERGRYTLRITSGSQLREEVIYLK